MSDKGAPTGSSPLLSLRDTDTPGPPLNLGQHTPVSQAGDTATPTAQTLGPLLCLAAPICPESHMAPSYRAFPTLRLGQEAVATKDALAHLYIFAFLSAGCLPEGPWGQPHTPPREPTGRMARSRGPALPSLPGRQFHALPAFLSAGRRSAGCGEQLSTGQGRSSSSLSLSYRQRGGRVPAWASGGPGTWVRPDFPDSQ